VIFLGTLLGSVRLSDCIEKRVSQPHRKLYCKHTMECRSHFRKQF